MPNSIFGKYTAPFCPLLRLLFISLVSANIFRCFFLGSFWAVFIRIECCWNKHHHEYGVTKSVEQFITVNCRELKFWIEDFPNKLKWRKIIWRCVIRIFWTDFVIDPIASWNSWFFPQRTQLKRYSSVWGLKSAIYRVECKFNPLKQRFGISYMCVSVYESELKHEWTRTSYSYNTMHT